MYLLQLVFIYGFCCIVGSMDSISSMDFELDFTMFFMSENPSSTYDINGITNQLEPTLSIDFSSPTSSPLLPLHPTPSTQVDSTVFAMTRLLPQPSESISLQQGSVFTAMSGISSTFPEDLMSSIPASVTLSALVSPSHTEVAVTSSLSSVLIHDTVELTGSTALSVSSPLVLTSDSVRSTSTATSSPLLPLHPTPSTQVESTVFAMTRLLPQPSESISLQQFSVFTAMSGISSTFLEDLMSSIPTSVTLSTLVSPSHTEVVVTTLLSSVLIHDTVELTGSTALSVSSPLVLTSDSVRSTSTASFSIDSSFVTEILPSTTIAVSTYFSSSIDEMSLSLDVMSSIPMSPTTFSISDGITPLVMTSSVVEMTYTSLPLITATTAMKSMFISSQSRSFHTVKRSTYILVTSTLVLESSQETDQTSFIGTRLTSSQSVIQKPSVSLYTILHSISSARPISTSFVLSSVSSTSFLHSSSLPALSNSFSSTVLPVATPISLPPPVFTVTALNSTALFVNWSSIADAIGYVIFIRENENGFSKRALLEDIIKIIGGDVTSHVINGLKPYYAYSIQMATVNRRNKTGFRSSLVSVSTNEGVPSPPRNVTWIDIGNNLINISWAPPLAPNGVIIAYIVTVTFHEDGTQIQHNVSRNLSLVITKPSNDDFIIAVSVMNRAGISVPQNATAVPSIDEIPAKSELSSGAVAGIVLTCIFIPLLVVIVMVVVIIVWRRWATSAGMDINVNEMEYKTGPQNDNMNDYSFVNGSEDNDCQLTAKRWMRANANYSTSSVLLPSIADLVSRYSTAEDVVGSKSIRRPQINGLGTIPETPCSPKELPEAITSSCDRSCEAPNKDFLRLIQHSDTDLTEREAGMRESELVDGNPPLFEMMENVYMATPIDYAALQQFEVVQSSVKINEQIGQGEHSKIMRATVSALSGVEEDIVAAKVLRDESTKEDFFGAAHILSQLSHYNVLTLLGVCTTTPYMVLIPYMELGDLKRYLTRVRRRTRLENQPCDFGLKDQLYIAMQIACGMEYLSSKFYIHRCLQAKYILLDVDFNVKISGFHMSRVLSLPAKYQELRESDKLPTKWLALETLTSNKFTPYTDVWSFGVVMWEIFSYGLTPYRGVQNNEVLDQLMDGRRLIKPPDCPKDIYTLMLHCWNGKCRERLQFIELQKHLSNILEHVKQHTEEGHDLILNPNFDLLGVEVSTQQPLPLPQVDPKTKNPTGFVTLEVVASQRVERNSELEMDEVALNDSTSELLSSAPDEVTDTISSIPEVVLSAQSNSQDILGDNYTIL